MNFPEKSYGLNTSNIVPILYAAILFLLIRIANDYPQGEDYLVHSTRFIIIELAGVTGGSMLCFHLARKWIKYSFKHGLNFAIEYVMVVLVPSLISLVVMALSHNTSFVEDLSDMIIPVIVTVLMSLWLYLTLKCRFMDSLYTESKLNEQEIRNEKVLADMRYLRAQFQPHFLFNMLNTIYFSIDEGNDRAQSIVEHLSNLLRSQLYDNDGMVAVEREISALDSYLELCRMRFMGTMYMAISIDRTYGEDMIHPHLLMPIVENAIKHSEGANPRNVSLTLKRGEGILELTVVNTVPIDLKNGSESDSGLGLKNLKKRLNLLYAGKYELMTECDGRIYTSYLKLAL